MRTPQKFSRFGMPFVAAIAAVGLSAACGSGDEQPENSDASGSSSEVTIEDNAGSHTIASPPKSVVALDNRTFKTLSDWDIKLSAAARSLMNDDLPYASDESIPDVGNHREPDLEVIAAAKPDLVINGQRFTGFQDDITKLVPDAAVIDLDPREGEPFDAELKRQSTTLGEIFGKQDEAKKLTDELDAAIARAKKAYDPAQKVMAVNTTGGEMGYLAPSVGRGLGPVFDILGLTPALEVEGASTGDKGDDISVEAIAQSAPDWILVLDRDAAVAADEPDYKPGAEIVEKSPALAQVPAVIKKQIVYMPKDTYLNEGIETYTTFFNDFADKLEAAN